MDLNKEAYKKEVKRRAPKSPILKNCCFAFLIGGGICVLGQGMFDFYRAVTNYTEESVYACVTVTMIFLAALLTGLGVFDSIAKVAGAGTLVPVTGFANSVVSPAIDTKAEGLSSASARRSSRLRVRSSSTASSRARSTAWCCSSATP